jgi:hypothetical protein
MCMVHILNIRHESKKLESIIKLSILDTTTMQILYWIANNQQMKNTNVKICSNENNQKTTAAIIFSLIRC